MIVERTLSQRLGEDIRDMLVSCNGIEFLAGQMQRAPGNDGI
jgi:hypothetical protein